MSRPCIICCSPEKARVVAELVTTGVTDLAIAERIGLSGNNGRMCVARHRVAHIQRPAQALAAVVDKGRSVRKRREETLAAAESGDDVTAFLGLEEITRDTRKVSKSLKRARKATENAGQYSVMTGVVAQEHKNLELRGKLGNHTGFVPQKLTPGEAMPVFNLVINMPNGSQERMAFTPEAADGPSPPVLDMPVLDFHVEGDDAPAVEQPDPEAVKLGRLFGPKK
jgi:hypothetical protein